jgi:predicted TIM-barrel fold metal-dependent hydrolase
VLVQPTYYGIDNSLLVQTLQEIGPQCRGVVRVADDAGDDELDRYHRAGIRAIRLDHFARASWPTGTSSPISTRSPTVPGRADDICSSTPLAPSSGSAAFFSDFEDTFVIDHMGYMKQSDGLTQADFDRFVVVLVGGHCYIKLSGPYRVAPGRPSSSVPPIGRALVTASPDRLLGSDWRISRTGSAIPANCSTSWSAGRPMTRIAVRSLSSPHEAVLHGLPRHNRAGCPLCRVT